MKLNNLSRLTALLLALTIFLSSVAFAAPVADTEWDSTSYQTMLSAVAEDCLCVTYYASVLPLDKMNGHTCVYEFLSTLGTTDQYQFLADLDNGQYQYLVDEETNTYSSYSVSDFLGAYYAHIDGTNGTKLDPLMCTCTDNLNGTYFNYEPGNGEHNEGCPWTEATETSTVIIPDIPQPPVYGGDPQGNQYTSNEEYDLPMANDRAIILPEGGRAVIHSNQADGYQWQVYDGTQWVSIQGETGADLVVTTAKLNTIFELTGVAELRYFDVANDIVKASVSVTSQEIAGGEYVDPVEEAQTLSLIERAEGDAVDENEWTVTVHFVFANSTDPVANDWVGEFEANKPANYAVPLPTVTGYYPTHNNVDISEQTTFDFALETITGNVEYTIVYKPSNVGYTVKHYLQKVDAESGDKTEANYELATDGTVPHDGLTGQMISETLAAGEELHKDYTGFRMIPYSTNFRVAADGSTVLEIYYDRDYYLMKFSLGDGGYGMEPIYDRYGADLTITEPTREGYTFAGWRLNGTGDTIDHADMPTTMPAENRTYVAQWTATNTTFTVVFWYENANNDKYTQAGALYNVSATSGSIVNGETYKDSAFDGRDAAHFTYERADENVMVKGDGSTVVNVYYSRNVYTVTFVLDNLAGSCDTETHTHTDACDATCSIEEHTHDESCIRTLTCTETEHEHSYECCSIDEHTAHTDDCCNYVHKHDKTCYGIAADAQPDIIDWASPPDNPADGYVYVFYYIGGSSKYIAYDGEWYSYTGSASNGTVVSCNIVHVHGDGNCNCTTALHTHGDGNCTCGETEHSHTAACYTYSCGKTEHTHTDSCNKCTLYEHTHSNGDCTLVVTAKYDSDITKVWLNAPIKTRLDDGYVFRSSVTQKYYSFLEKMPGQDITMTATEWSGNKYVWYYYLEVLPGMDTTGLTTRTDNGVTYYLYDTTTVYGSRLSLTYDEDYYPITGFTQRDSSVPSFSNRTAYLYYRRNSYELAFSNYGKVVEGKGGTYYYQADISGTSFTPDYPSTLEANAYEFEGWYESPFFGDTKFNFTTTDEDGNVVKATMPAHNVTLYAKWELVTHEVYFYEDEAAYDAGNKYIDEVVEVTHGGYVDEKLTAEQRTEDYNKIDNIDELYKDGKYTFLGWFYKDGDVEKAFDPFDMPVKRDMHLYAKWSSDVLVDFEVNYVLEAAPTVKVADSITGQALAATTETYEAKIGTDLYNSLQGNGVNYQSGYFPTVSSHSITFVIEGTNSYTFYYVPMDIVPYTVYYVAETLAEGDEDKYTTKIELNGKEYYVLADTEVYSKNTKSVVTEPYKPVAGYKPNAYQQKLILSVVWDEAKQEFVPNDAANIIIFEYTPDPTSTTYYIWHYIGDGDGDGEWTLYAEEPRPGNYGDLRYAQPITIPGYTFDPGVDGTIREGTLVEGETLILKLYYVQEEVKINYKVVAPDGVQPADVGTVAINDNDDTTVPGINASESVKILTGEAKGAEAEAKDNTYKFVGWYLDEDCTIPVPDAWITNTNHITPQKTKDYDETLDGEKFGYEAATYYAKFEYNLTSMTIKKAAGANTTIGTNETFIFTVSGKGLPDSGMKVVIQGTNEVTINGLTVGETYTVVEDTNWSWRYTGVSDHENGQLTLSTDAKVNKITFTNTRTNDQWLSDESSIVNFDGTNQ